MLFRGVPELDPGYPRVRRPPRALDDGMSRSACTTSSPISRASAPPIGAGIEPLADAALFEVTGATANAKLPKLVSEILALLAGLRDAAITADEIDKIRTRYRYETLASLDDPAAMAGWFGGTALYYPPPSLSARLDSMAAIGPDDIVATARRVLVPDGLRLAAVGALSKARVGELREIVTAWRADRRAARPLRTGW